MIKKIQGNFLLLAAALIAALAFSACGKSKPQSADSGGSVSQAKAASPFEGTWRSTIPGYGDMDIIFTGNEFVQTLNRENFVKGSFTYTASEFTETNIHFWKDGKWAAEAGLVETSPYTLSSNTLTISSNGTTLTFIKQP